MNKVHTTQRKGGNTPTPHHLCLKENIYIRGKIQTLPTQIRSTQILLQQILRHHVWLPVEVETDCQALRDVLMNDKLSAMHARWREGVLAHNIIDVRHIPGVTNIADGISRQYENTLKSGNDGSKWDVDSDWETAAGLVYGVNCVSTSPTTQSLRDHFATTPLF